MKILLIAALAALAIPAAAQTVYRCTDSAGHVTFQQGLCALSSHEKVIEVKPGNIIESDQAEVDSYMRSSYVSSAIARGQIVEGMTEGETIAAIGYPRAVNTDRIDGHVMRQSVYRYGDGSSRYVYTRDGTVYATQERVSAGRIGRRGWRHDH